MALLEARRAAARSLATMSAVGAAAAAAAVAPPAPPALAAGLALVRELIAAQALDARALANVLGGEDGEGSADLSLLYGETPVEGVVRAFASMDESLGEEVRAQGRGAPGPVLRDDGSQVFVDIGSGRGHVVLAAAAMQRWKRCVGVEVVEAHVSEARKSAASLSALEAAGGQRLRTAACDIAFECKDAVRDPSLAPLLGDADVIYCFDLAFQAELRAAVYARLAASCKEGALLLSTHLDRVPSALFAPVGALFSIDMEWGACPARLYRRGAGAYEAWLPAHRAQLEAVHVPREAWPAVCAKMIEQRFDVGRFVEFATVDDETDRPTGEVVLTAQNALAPGPEAVFLVDHAWSFASRAGAEAALAQVPGLRERMLALCAPRRPADESAAAMLDACGALLASYRLAAAPGAAPAPAPVFFVLDEVGSALRRKPEGVSAELQEGEPNMRLGTVYSRDHRMAFSLAWPLKRLEPGSILFAEHEQGWDKAGAARPEVPLDVAGGSEAMAPEMKEFAAQAQLKKMIESAHHNA